jgi:hypothetical protein
MKFSNEVLNITRFKILLTFLLLIPSITLFIIIFGLNFYSYYHLLDSPLLFLNRLGVYIVLGIILSYIISCLVDYLIPNQNMKIMIAFISGLLSIIILYTIYKVLSDPIICDPVHIPSNQTVCDPVHKPGQNGYESINQIKEIKVDTAEINQYLKECIKNL